MSFLSTAFSGASNNFTPAGSEDATRASITANQNQANAQTGFTDLATALKLQASGQGPSLSNQQLQNATGQNVANQAALMGGQRGASSNVGLMSRQIANQGANIQQQAAGQSASNRLAEQLAARAQLNNVYSNQANSANQTYGIAQGTISGNNQVGANIAGQNAKMNQQLIGGVANAGMGLMGLAEGGKVPGKAFDFGGDSGFGFNFTSMAKPKPMKDLNASIPASSMQVLGARPEVISDPTEQNYAEGGATRLPFAPMTDYKHGGPVQAPQPNERAVVQGNSSKNDKIPAMLSEGESVIDRETMNDPGPVGKMARALTKHIEAKKAKR